MLPVYLVLYGKIWLLGIHTKECVYTSLHDKHKEYINIKVLLNEHAMHQWYHTVYKVCVIEVKTLKLT